MTSHTGLALSVRQPWADAILGGAKPAEYRSQPTNVRGRIYIYASLGGAPAAGDGRVRGAIVGEVTLVDCLDEGDRYAWLLDEPQRWDTPLAPTQRANPVWFRPWGNQAPPHSDASQSVSAEPVTADTGQDLPAVEAVVTEATSGGHQRESAAEPVEASEAPPPDRPATELVADEDAMAVVRRLFDKQVALTRDEAIPLLAREMGHQRAGARIAERMDAHLRTAVRRGVIVNDDGVLMPGARSLDRLDRALLKKQFVASIGRTWMEREEAVRAFARWMGFRRTGSSIDASARSLMRTLLRDGQLEAQGSRVRRT